MQVILQGSFAHFSPDQLLTLFSTFRHSGTLEILSKESRARVFFRDGSVIHAEGTAAAPVEEIVSNLFVWSEGTFTFAGESVLPEGAKAVTIDLKAVIAEGLRRADERRRLLELYPSEEINLGVVEDPRTEGQINLTPEEFKILMKIGSGRTLARLRIDLKMTAAELYPAVHRLETAGLILRVATAPPASRTPEEVPTVINASVAQAPIATPSKSMAAKHPKEPSVDVPLIGSLTAANGAMFPIIDDVYVIGRDATNQIAINDNSVSSQHARISRSEKGFVIQDVNSRNGTFVNGEKVTAPRVLADSDVVRLGKVVFTFKIASHMPAPLLTK